MALTKVTFAMVEGQSANVLDFGAVGNGVANDTQAIQNAINSGASSVYLPAGTYIVTSEITIPGNCYLYGDGMGQTIVRATTVGAGKAIFKVTNSKAGFSDMTLRGPSVNSYVADEQGIWFYDTTGPTKELGFVENVEIYDVGSAGIVAEYFNKVSVTDCYIHNVGYIGVAITSAYDSNISNNIIRAIGPGTVGNAYGVTISSRITALPPTRFVVEGNIIRDIPVWTGIDTHGGYDGLFSNNLVIGCKIGIVATRDDDARAPARVQIIGNTIDRGSLAQSGTGFGIVVAGNDAGTAAALSCTVVGNDVSGMGPGGSNSQGVISIQTTDSTIVSNNNLRQCYGNAIVFNNVNTNAMVTGNTISLVSSFGGFNIAGLKFESANNTGFVGNNYVDATNTYPLFINAACRGLTFGENTFITSGSAPASGVKIAGYQNAGAGLVAYGSVTRDVGSLASLASEVFTAGAANCRPGDFCEVSSNADLNGIMLFGNVNANDTVEITAFNATGGVIDLPSATYYVRVMRNGAT